MLFAMERRIHIGINNQAGPKERHGLLWIDAQSVSAPMGLLIPVIIDKPHLVAEEGLSFATWKRVKKQLDKMGIVATHIELDFRNKGYEKGGHFCYKLDRYKEIYCEGGKGKPIFREIPA